MTVECQDVERESLSPTVNPTSPVLEEETAPVRRLVIREMILENFKSYAGAQRVGPFHKSFSSVVGPNGSGKSNVIDAMLFVFGKRAKQLRLNKVSELIHNSTHHRNLDMARVSVYFHEIVDTSDDESGYDVIPGSEFVVTRTAHRNNKSDYYIGDSKSNFKEVTTLLKGKGIDLDNNRFLILQGEVEQISMMKPKGLTEHETGLLEYLEDIIGTDAYIEKIEEVSKHLDEIQESRQGMVNRLKIAERERDGLEAAKKAAEAYIAKEIECAESKRLLSGIYIQNVSKNIEKIQDNMRELEEKHAEEAEKCKAYTEQLASFEAEYTQGSTILTKMNKEMDDYTAEFKEFERTDIKRREDIKHLKTKLKKAEDKAAKDLKKAVEIRQDVQKITLEIPNLEKRVEEAARKVKPAEEELDKMVAGTRGETEELLGELRKVRAELAPWEKQIIHAKSKIEVSQSEIEMLEKAREKAMEKYQEACASCQEAKETAKSKLLEVKDMEHRIDGLKENVSIAVAEEARAMDTAKKTEAMAKEVRGRVEQKKSDASQRASQTAAMAALYKARESNSIPGIRGRLGDLGAIDAAYDVAISTACPPLDYIVVDTTSAAQRCVELLRTNKLGVATFLILEKQSHLKKFLSERVDTPEQVPRLFDLVKCDDNDIRLAFYFALRDTLVAKDLEQATRIAYSGNRRWSRVVTLKGEMINENGTMSGGGAKPRGGRICVGEKARVTKVDDEMAANEAKHAEKELEELTRQVKDARANVAEKLAQVKAAKSDLSKMETSIVKSRMDAESSKKFADDLEMRLPELKARTILSREDSDRISLLTQTVKEDQAVLKDLENKSGNVRSKVANMEKDLGNVGGPALKRQKELVASLQAEVTSAEADAAKKVAQIKNAQKQITKLENDAKKAEEEAEELKAAHDKSMLEFKVLEEEAFKVVEKMNAQQERLQQKESEVKELKHAFEQKQKEVSVIRQVEVEILSEIDGQKGLLAEESAKKQHWVQEYARSSATLKELIGTAPEEITPEIVSEANEEEIQYKITVLEEEMERMDVNPDAISAWTMADNECTQRASELEIATASRDEIKSTYDTLRKKRLEEFMNGFNIISLKLKEMYQMITMGGDAELELVDSLDPFSEGILFSVRPPKKSWKNIANLSGGEKTLSSLSLVFALHHFKPTPLYVMDEIDAALDFKNVSIVGNYIRERTKNAQFIIISLRNNMFELADRLVGIYKTDNATKSIPVNPGNFSVGCIRA